MTSTTHGAAPLHYGAVACHLSIPEHKTGYTTAVPAMRWRPSCGTPTVKKAMPTGRRRNSMNCPKPTVMP